MKFSMKVTCPGEEPGFVEYKRAFTVQGKIECISETEKEAVPEDALLTINLVNETGEVVRHIYCDRKNKKVVAYYPGLTAYEEELDPGRVKMQDFGYPPLIVDDPENPEASVHNATIKAWYNDSEFKGIFISATDVEHGAIFDDGMHFTDENGNPYSTLPMGNYTVEVKLTKGEELLGSCTKQIKIERRKDQLICRFNPWSHKLKMIDWCAKKGFAIINDLLPGYLEPYLWKWFYHMGLLKMYRANDICLFETATVRMFVYLIDETSTSYETELAYVQQKNEIDKPGRLVCYHYDIGEAVIGKGRSYEREANTPEFAADEYMALCRIDVLNDKAVPNVYFIDERAVDDVIFDLNNAKLKAGSKVALMGVIKPWQMDPNDFVLQDNNIYDIKNAPEIIRYTFCVDGDEVVAERPLNMERIDEYSIGKSVFEFYNDFKVPTSWAGKKISVKIECIDKKGNITPAKCEREFEVE